MNPADSTRRASASVLGAVHNGGSNEPAARDADSHHRAPIAPSRNRMQTAIRAAFRMAQGLSAARRRPAAVTATPESLRARHQLAGVRFGGIRGGIETTPPIVFCGRDLTGHVTHPATLYTGVIR